MTLADVKRIEEELGVIFPLELKESYTSDLLNGIEEFPIIAELFFLCPDDIIEINQSIRNNGFWGKSFPPNIFIIGQGEDTYYIINLHESPLRVFRVMNNEDWKYNPDDLDKNLTCSVPGKQGLDTYIKSYPLFSLRSSQEEEQRREQGLSEEELSADEVYDFLESLSKREN
jgi:hypothetical protein